MNKSYKLSGFTPSFPLLLLAIIFVVPRPTPFTYPLSSTVATPELLLTHVIFLFVALLGITVPFNSTLSPI